MNVRAIGIVGCRRHFEDVRVTHPMPLVAHALYGFKNPDGIFVATRLLPVFHQSYVEESQKRRYKFLFKRPQGDFDAQTRLTGRARP